MPTDYSYLLDEYPATISQDQLYRICHISKRKATWLLLNGYIPCKDTGKKTRRFTIQTKDVISYLTLLETNPEALLMPIGIFSSGANGQAKANPCLLIDSEKFATFLHNVWSAIPDALSVKDASKLLGYSCGAVDHWISKGQLKAVRYRGSYLIPKDDLINFLAVTGNYSICQKSEKHLELICGYTSK